MPAPRYSYGKKRELPPLSRVKTEDDDGDDDENINVPLSQAAPPSSQLAAPTQLERPPECINRHSTPAFAILCSVMDRMRNEKATKRTETLTRFFNLWRSKVGNDLYPLIRLLLPDVR